MDRNGGRINLLNPQVAAGDCSRDGVFGQRRDTSTRLRPNYSKLRIFDPGDLTEQVLMNLRPNLFTDSGGRGGDGSRDNHIGGGLVGTPSAAYAGYGNRASGLRSGFQGYGGRDVWGHWGGYYGPMIPNIF